jgi:hypothetical protein
MSIFSPIAEDLIEVFTKDRGQREAARESVPAAE